MSAAATENNDAPKGAGLNIKTPEFIRGLFPLDSMPKGETVCMSCTKNDGTDPRVNFDAKETLNHAGRTKQTTYYCISSVSDKKEAGKKGGQEMIRRKRDTLKKAYVFGCDDIGTKKASEPPIAPTYRLETSQGSYHWGYSLEPFTLDKEGIRYFEACVHSAAAAGWTDPGAEGAYRLLRVPGSIHKTKTDADGNPFRARLHEWHPERVWKLEELMQELGIEPIYESAEIVHLPTSTAATEKDSLWDFLKTREPEVSETDDMQEYQCPWHDKHESEGVTAGFSPLGKGDTASLRESRQWNCFHGHCKDKDIHDFKTWAVSEGWGGDFSDEPKNVFELDDMSLPAFNPELFPDVISNLAVSVNGATGVDPACSVMASIAACGAAIDKRIRFRPKPSMSPEWWITPTLFTATVGEASTGKTPGTTPSFAPLKKQQMFIDEEASGAYAEYKFKHKVYENLHRKAVTAAAGGEDYVMPDEPPPPKHRHLVVTGSTTEGMEATLVKSPWGSFKYTEELAQWFESHDHYSDGNGTHDQAAWIMFYDGNGGMSVRANHSRKYETGAGVHGNIQPSVMDGIAEKLSENGLLARFLLATLRGKRSDVSKPQSPETVKAYENTIQRLTQLSPPLDINMPRMLDCSPEGEQLIVEYIRRNDKEPTASNNG